MAAAAAIPAITTTTQIVGEAASKSIEVGREAVSEVRSEAEKVFSRKTSHYDYEKVFFNSVFSVGLLLTGWLALKLGQGTIALTKWLNDGPLAILTGPLIDDVSMANMEMVGDQLAQVDRVLTPAMPALPVAMVGMQAALEYRRVRSIYDPMSQKIADGVIAGGAFASLYLAYSAWSQRWVKPADGGENGNGGGDGDGDGTDGQTAEHYFGYKGSVFLVGRGFTIYYDTPNGYYVMVKNLDGYVYDFIPAGQITDRQDRIDYFTVKINSWQTQNWPPVYYPGAPYGT